jgi:radical SAM family uncharacterized protein/radical SAM-linked protein
MDYRSPSTPDQITTALEHILPWVQKPARYTGGELNSVSKVWDQTPLRVALVFPDVYEIGMSNLGLAVLYDILNRQHGVLAERAYAPWIDMEEAMRRAGVPLFSLESRRPLWAFDIVGISLPYEQLYTNALNVLDLASIPLRTGARSAAHPLVLAGGAATFNPEPMHAFFDAFLIGEGEDAILDIVNVFLGWRERIATKGSVIREGVATVQEAVPAPSDRGALLRDLSAIPGVYVPTLYRESQGDDGRAGGIQAAEPKAQFPIVKRIVPTLPPPLTRPVVPYLGVVHDRAAVEIRRGCARGCRFCLAGMTYRPVRERPVEEVLSALRDLVEHTGFDEVALLSLSSSDYSGIIELVEGAARGPVSQDVSISLPSLRIESFSVELLERLSRGRRRGGFTFAPEAATDRLRQVINKPIATDIMLQVAAEVFARGWTTIKLYFMIGHPTQTEKDVASIIDLARQIRDIGRQQVGGRTRVRVSVSTFVPKPHTPFQWQPLAPSEEIGKQIDMLRRGLRKRGLELSWNDPQESLIEAALSRGDRRLADVVQRAWELGARFDAWQDHFSFDKWARAFEEMGLDPDWYARGLRRLEDPLPWDHVSTGIRKEFLIEEHRRAVGGEATPYCRDQCHSCGILRQYGRLRQGSAWECPSPITDREPGDDMGTQPDPQLSDEPIGPRPPSPSVQRLRLTFSVGDELKYISHLDMMRVWERTLRRARIPLAYSQGFHPQPRIQFAAPLAVGFTGRREVVDLLLTRRADPTLLAEELATHFPPGVQIGEILEVDLREPSLPSQVRAAEYTVYVESEETATRLSGRVDDLLAAPEIRRERRRKGRLREYNLRPLIQALRYQGRESDRGWHRLEMRLQVEGGATGRPDEVLAALSLDRRARRIERTQILFMGHRPGEDPPSEAVVGPRAERNG